MKMTLINQLKEARKGWAGGYLFMASSEFGRTLNCVDFIRLYS